MSEGGQHLGIRQLVIRPDPREVQNLPQAHAERPDVGLGGVSVLSDGLRRHPAERHQEPLLGLEVVLLVGRAVAPEITDFDMITFANQAVPVRRLGDQFNPQTHSILTSAP